MDFEWNRKVDELKAKAAEFFDVYTRLRSLEPIARADKWAWEKYQSLMNTANAVRDKIDYVMGLAGQVFSWFTANGIAPSNAMSGLGNLGLLWLPITAITGAIAVIAVWVTDAYTEIKRLEAVDEYVKQGLTIEQAWAKVRSNGGITESVEQAIRATPFWLAAGAAAVLLVPQLMKRKR